MMIECLEFSPGFAPRGTQKSRSHGGHPDRVHWHHTTSVWLQQRWETAAVRNGKVS